MDRKWLEYLKDMLNTLAGKLTALLAFALLVIFFIGTFGDFIPQNYIWLIYVVVILAMAMTFILAIMEVCTKHRQQTAEEKPTPPAEKPSTQTSHSDEPDPQAQKEKLNAYLNGLIHKCQTLPLMAVGDNSTADIDLITLEKNLH